MQIQWKWTLNIPSIMCFFSVFFSRLIFFVFIRSRLILRSMYFFDIFLNRWSNRAYFRSVTFYRCQWLFLFPEISAQILILHQTICILIDTISKFVRPFKYGLNMYIVYHSRIQTYVCVCERKSKTIARLDLCLYKCDQWYGRDDNNVTTSEEKKMMTATTTTRTSATMHRTYRITK